MSDYNELLKMLSSGAQSPGLFNPPAHSPLTPYLSTPFAPLLGTTLTRQNLYYRNKKINIDGYIFKNCRFDNCELITKRGDFQFIECVFDDSTVVSYHGSALKIIKLYNRKDQKRTEGLSPQINPDGTVTIKSDTV